MLFIISSPLQDKDNLPNGIIEQLVNTATSPVNGTAESGKWDFLLTYFHQALTSNNRFQCHSTTVGTKFTLLHIIPIGHQEHARV
jgi:hypothetical protein